MQMFDGGVQEGVTVTVIEESVLNDDEDSVRLNMAGKNREVKMKFGGKFKPPRDYSRVHGRFICFVHIP